MPSSNNPKKLPRSIAKFYRGLDAEKTKALQGYQAAIEQAVAERKEKDFPSFERMAHKEIVADHLLGDCVATQFIHAIKKESLRREIQKLYEEGKRGLGLVDKVSYWATTVIPTPEQYEQMERDID